MKRKHLTTLEAANIGRKMGVRGLCICRNPVDRNLWQVATPFCTEAHEPMDEKTWRAFLTASGWIESPARYDAGRGRKVTVPDDPAEPAKELRDLLQDCMSPQAVAAIVSYLQPCNTNSSTVNKEVAWFSGQLVELLGGYEQQARLAEELGL